MSDREGYISPEWYNFDCGLKPEDFFDVGQTATVRAQEYKDMDVLKMVGRRKWDKEQGKSDSNSITVWSALYNLTDRTVTWVSNEEYGNSDAIFKLGF